MEMITLVTSITILILSFVTFIYTIWNYTGLQYSLEECIFQIKDRLGLVKEVTEEEYQELLKKDRKS